MITTLTNTDSAEIASTLTDAHQREGAASGMVHTLIVACHEVAFERAFEAALDSAREHPSRVLLVVDAPSTGDEDGAGLEARVQVGEGVPGDVVTLRVPPSMSEHLETLLLPLLLPDSPVVAWWPGESPARLSNDPIGRLATRRITDAGGVEDPLAALLVRARHHDPGDTDLTWTRLTPWRALLAASLDQYPAPVRRATVEAAAHNAPAELLSAWLAHCLGVPVERVDSEGPGITGVRLVTDDGDIALLRPEGSVATYEVPGQPRRSVALARRGMNGLITEELRHQDPDEVFEQACSTFLERVEADEARTSSPRVGGGAAAEPLSPADTGSPASADPDDAAESPRSEP